MSLINQKLEEMRSLTNAKEKGDAGESITIDIVKRYKLIQECTIIQSLSYPVATRPDGTEYPGNLKLGEDKEVFIETRGYIDEVDVVLLTPRRIFLIEVKSYKNATIKFTNDWSYRNGSKVDKDILNQTEKHSRHFYHQFVDVIPEGQPAYVIPIFCSVDKSKVINESEDRIPICTLNNLLETIARLDRQGEHSINIGKVVDRAREISNKELQFR